MILFIKLLNHIRLYLLGGRKALLTVRAKVPEATLKPYLCHTKDVRCDISISQSNHKSLPKPFRFVFLLSCGHHCAEEYGDLPSRKNHSQRVKSCKFSHNYSLTIIDSS